MYAILFFLAFLSGVSALMYEVAWTRQLTLVFGVSIYAASAVIAAFMMGLGAGSFVFGTIADRTKRPLLLYAALEAGIAVYAILFATLFSPFQRWVVHLTPAGEAALPALLLRFVPAFLILLPPTFLMGGTLPVLSVLFRSRVQQMGRNIALLYGLNTLGAAAGAFFSGFVILPASGIHATILIAVAGNALLAAAALVLSFKFRALNQERAASGTLQTAVPPPEISPARKMVLPLIALLTGFCSLGYEIIWTKLLILSLGNSTWAFSTVLIVFLLSLAVGGLLAAPLSVRVLKRPVLLSTLLIGMSALALFSLYWFRWSLFDPASLTSSSLIQVVALQFLTSIPVIFPAALLSGLILPLLIRWFVSGPPALASGFGRVLAANTVGSVLGAVIVGLVWLQGTGIQNALFLLVLLNAVAAGLVFLVVTEREQKPVLRFKRFAMPAAIALPALGLFLTSNPPLTEPPTGYEMVYYKENSLGTLAVYEHPDAAVKVFDINNITEVATDSISLYTFQMMARLPLYYNPDPDSILVITFGAGLVSGYLAQWTDVPIRCVEINPDAAEVGRVFAAENGQVLEQQQIELIIEDGRNFLLTRPGRYGIITADATHPTGADSWLLYTKEFYELCASRLSPDGLFLQWLPLHALSPEQYRTIVATCARVFPHVSLWFTGLEGPVGHTVLLAGNQPIQSPGTDLIPFPGSATETPELLFLADRDHLKPYLAGAPVNTDDLPYTGFPRELPSPAHTVENLAALLPYLHEPEWLKSQTISLSAMHALLKAYVALARDDAISHGRNVIRLLQDIPRFRTMKAADLPFPYRNMQHHVAQEFIRRGLRATREGKNDEAVDLLSAAVNLGRQQPQVYLTLANLFKQTGKPDSAIQVLVQGIRQGGNAALHFELATLYLEAGILDRAASHYRQTLRLNPNLGIAWNNLGMIHAMERRWDQAESAWKRALEINPADSLAYRNLQKLRKMQ